MVQGTVEEQLDDGKWTRHGYVWWLSAFTALGGIYQGYCIGLVPALTHNHWTGFDKNFKDLSATKLNALFLLAAFVGALPCVSAIAADSFGRRQALAIFNAIAFVAAIIMTATPTGTTSYLFIGRGLSGLANGAISVLVPTYQSEVAPAALRGRLMTTFQLAIAVGIAASCVCAFLLEKISTLEDASWRLALLLQVVPTAVLAIGLPFIPESPRWYMLRSREGAARRELFRIRQSNKLDVMQELHEMRTYARHHNFLCSNSADEEPARSAYHRSAARMAARILSLESGGKSASSSVRPTPLVLESGATEANPDRESSHKSVGGGSFSRKERRAIGLAIWLKILTQFMGINMIMYFAGTFSRHFSDLPFLRAHTPLFTLMIFVTINFLCAVPLTFLIDRLGRRALLTGGAIGMAVCWAIETALSVYLVHRENEGHLFNSVDSLQPSNTMSAAYRMLLQSESPMEFLSDARGLDGVSSLMAPDPPQFAYSSLKLIYFSVLLVFIGLFSVTWGGITWATTCELIPVRWHASGVALALSANWGANLVVAIATVYLPAIPYGSTFISAAFTLCCIVAAVSTHWLLPETKLVSLENVESSFAFLDVMGKGGRAFTFKTMDAPYPHRTLSQLLPSIPAVTDSATNSAVSPVADATSSEQTMLDKTTDLDETMPADFEKCAICDSSTKVTDRYSDLTTYGSTSSLPVPSGPLPVVLQPNGSGAPGLSQHEVGFSPIAVEASRPWSRASPFIPSASNSNFEQLWPNEAPGRDSAAEDVARNKHEQNIYTDPALALLCALDAWLSVLSMFVVALSTLVMLTPDAGNSTMPLSSSNVDAVLAPPTPPSIHISTVPNAIFDMGLWTLASLVNVALLGLFFMRDWALVLFLWKLFHYGLLLLQLVSAILDACLSSPHRAGLIAATGLLALYTCYTILLLRQLWLMPRVREHYRRLPTRREAPSDIGYLQFGSFFFRRQDVIGTGGSSRVYKGMYAGQLVAVKELATSKLAAGAAGVHGLSEANLLSRLRHPFVLHFFGCCVHDSHLYLVTELCDTSLHELLTRDATNRAVSARTLSLQPRLSLAMQIAEGVQYLHENGIVHRDLKPANILLALDPRTGGLVAKIGDFGLSRTTDSPEMTALIGTVQYMAPEVLTGSQKNHQRRFEYTAAVDIFSFAIILWQLLTSAEPYESLGEINRFLLLQRIARDGLRPDVPAWVAPNICSLLSECWSEAEHKRPTSAELVRRLCYIHKQEFGDDWRITQAGIAAATSSARRMLEWRQSFPR